MPKKKVSAIEANPGLDPENCQRLEELMMDYAERRPELEQPILTMARECGLDRVTARIKRMRRYANLARGGTSNQRQASSPKSSTTRGRKKK